MAANSERIPSACSLKRPGTGDEQLQILSPEGSTVYMTEVSAESWHDNHRHGNPITNKGTTVLGVPRKTSTQIQSIPPPESVNVGNSHSNSSDTDLYRVTNQLSELTVTSPDAVGKEQIGADGSLSNTSSESGEDGDVLERAGVVGVDLNSVELGPDGKAPIELVSQFVFCLMRDEYEAAILLCEKVIELEPLNETAAQFYPLIQERIKLDDELPTESSSSESEEEDEESDDDSSDHSSSSESSEENCKPSAKSEELNTTLDHHIIPPPQPAHSHKHCTHTSSTWQP